MLPSSLRQSLVSALLCVSAWFVAADTWAYTVTPNDVNTILRQLDHELDNREIYIERRRQRIDSLSQSHFANPRDVATAGQLARTYTSFNNDSAIAVYDRAIAAASLAGNDSLCTLFSIERATILPLGGFLHEAITEMEAIDTTAMSRPMMARYLAGRRQMYSYLSSFFPAFPATSNHYTAISLDAQRQLIDLLPIDSDERRLNMGEYHYSTGRHALCDTELKDFITRVEPDDNLYARATHILADNSRALGRNDEYVYYLCLSAISDTRAATLEVTSLQDLGKEMFAKGDIDRAHSYLYTALRNAVECHAETRMLQTSEAVPLIESVHSAELLQSRNRIFTVIIIMAATLAALVIALLMLRAHIISMRRLQKHLEEANHTKEVYISQFLNLCSVYMDKLNQVCELANRKISTGKTDELYRLTRSGRFIENQSREFYEVFDESFLHLHPDFVAKVNELLQPDCRFEAGDGQGLTNDLRILALLRLGITDSSRIAQILNYSINTVYSYRNRLRNRAVNRDTFEADIASL